MSRYLLCSACLLVALAVGPLAAAEPLLPPLEMLPPGPPLLPYGPIPDLQPPYEPPLSHRHSDYEVWQYYGVTQQGRWRPRVIYSPYGPYYQYNGAYYPWADTHPSYFRIYRMDTP